MAIYGNLEGRVIANLQSSMANPQSLVSAYRNGFPRIGQSGKEYIWSAHAKGRWSGSGVRKDLHRSRQCGEKW